MVASAGAASRTDRRCHEQDRHVRLLQNGTKIFSGTRVTRAPSGSFTVRKVTANKVGTDTIRGRAVNAATGETCSGSAAFTA